MYVLTTCRSKDRDRTEVMEMGLKSEGSAGCAVLGIRVMKALFHWHGTTQLWMDWLKSWANGTERLVRQGAETMLGLNLAQYSSRLQAIKHAKYHQLANVIRQLLSSETSSGSVHLMKFQRSDRSGLQL